MRERRGVARGLRREVLAVGWRPVTDTGILRREVCCVECKGDAREDEETDVSRSRLKRRHPCRSVAVRRGNHRDSAVATAKTGLQLANLSSTDQSRCWVELWQ